jgi:hypothetical protein
MFTEQQPLYRKAIVEWEVLQRSREGETNVWAVLDKQQDQNRWITWSPPGMKHTLPVPSLNKADRLCVRVTSQVFADPAIPQPVATTDEDADKDAAELEGRILRDLDDESGLGDAAKHRRAFDLAHVTGSAFIAYRVCPYAGGYVPVQIDAGPAAQTVEDATHDPTTGQPWPQLEPRYVRPDGSLTDVATDAAREWQPAIESEVLHPRKVRLWPASATSLYDAEGVIEAGYKPFRELRRIFADIQDVDVDAATITAETVPETEFLRPKSWKKTSGTSFKDAEDRLAFYLVVTLTPCWEYPHGCRFVMIGKDTLVSRGTWEGEYEGKVHLLDLPYTQHMQFQGDPESPVCFGTMRVLKPANEARALLIGAISDIADRNQALKTFVPTTSIYQGKEALLGFLTHIPINPGGEPKREDPIPVPPEFVRLIEFWSSEMDDASQLQQAGQALETPDAQSGRAKLAVLSQVHVGLSDLRQNAERAIVRAWRIKSQLIRVYYTTDRLVQWEGEDGAYRVERWRGSDLGSTRDVMIKPGSFSMMSAAQKAQRAIELMQVPGLVSSPHALQEYVFGTVAAEIGWRDEPHRNRARRQVAAWQQGPPDGVVQSPPAPGPSVPDPVTGLPVQGPPVPGPDPRAMAIFQPLLCDSQPDIAAIRLREFARAMASVSYQQWPPAWRAGLDAAYTQARQVLQPPPSPAPPSGQGPPNASGGPPQGGPPSGAPPSPPATGIGAPNPGESLTPTEQAMAAGGV